MHIGKNSQDSRFERQLLASILVPNLVGIGIIALYCFLFAGLAGTRLVPGVSISGGIIIAINLFLSTFVNKFIASDVSADLDEWQLHPSTGRERTHLLRRVMGCPAKLAVLEMLKLGGGTMLWLLALRWLFDFKGEALVMAFMAALMGSYGVAILSMTSSQRICSSFGCRIVEQGLDAKAVQQWKSFGMTSESVAVLYGLVPLFLVSGVSIAVVWRSTLLDGSQGEGHLLFLWSIGVVNLFYILLFFLILSRRVMVAVNRMRNMLEAMGSSVVGRIQNASTDLSNSFMYNIHLVNSIVNLLHDILNNSRETSSRIISYSGDLDTLSDSTLSTATEQYQGIEDLLSIMRREDGVPQDAARKVDDIALMFHKTDAGIREGMELLEERKAKLEGVRHTNTTIFSKVRELEEKISSISDIALIINSIADQTSLIAFNTEMEVANSGREGQEFRLVAQEIRQLANSTVELTKEIRDRVADIHHCSQELMGKSRSTEVLVERSDAMMERLANSLKEMQSAVVSGDITISDIQAIIQQQATVLQQVKATLLQLALDTKNLSTTIQIISHSSRNLSVAAAQLGDIEDTLVKKEVSAQ